MRSTIEFGHSLKAHDAVHFSAAKRLEVAEFFTYDERLFKFDRLFGFRVIAPEVTPEPVTLFNAGLNGGQPGTRTGNTHRIPEV